MTEPRSGSSSVVGDFACALAFVADPMDPMSFGDPSDRIVGETTGAAY
jgi:hypothetical protein